ncbi:MAG: hypothetical protein H7175_25120, partial [Burkholderiales bacterium]|nr:hypothetical protein [Anaerolineae bacterium]
MRQANPQPISITDTYSESTVFFAAERDVIIFPNQCVNVRWSVDGIREVYLNGQGQVGAGEQCVTFNESAQGPRLGVIFNDGTGREYFLNEIVVWSSLWWVRALLFAAVVLAAIGLYLRRGASRSAPTDGYVIAVILAIVWVVAIDLLTNTIDLTRVAWDPIHYVGMAENGILGNPNLVAPFAYRPVVPMLARVLTQTFGVSTWTGFMVVAYVGAVTQLVGVFALARYFKASVGQSLVVMSVAALSMFNVKFLLFDASRPDHLAYPLLIVAVIALFERRIVLCLLASCVGLLTREFLIIPPLFLCFTLLREFRQTRSVKALIWIAVILAATAAVLLLPRVLIPVTGTAQRADPTNNPEFLNELVEIPLSMGRNYNLLFTFVSYLLPTIMLSTRGRLRRTWARLAGYKAFLVFYLLVMLGLSFYGGSDLPRYMTFLLIPQTIVLAVLLRDESIDICETGLMLVMVALYNRIAFVIPF